MTPAHERNLDESLCRLVFASEGKDAHFFGYFDICPWSDDGDALLCHRVVSSNAYLTPSDSVEVGVFLKDGPPEFQPISTTGACNWQQGSMLRWCGGSSERLIFNDFDEAGYCARLMRRSGGDVKRIGAPVYDVSRDGRYGLSISPERLWYTRRSYAYGRQPTARWSTSIVDGDALRIVDLETDVVRPLVDVRTLAEHQQVASMENALHWVDHPLFSPDGARVAFFHRWLTPTGSFLTRLYSCSVGGEDLFMYPDGGMYSHLTWRDSDRFVVFARPPGRDIRTDGSDKSLRKRLISLGIPVYRKLRGLGVVQKLRNRMFNDRYLQFSVGSGTSRVVAPNCTVDGHPSFCPTAPDVMLTDTYPDKRGLQHLMLVNAVTGAFFTLARLPVPRGLDNSSPNRCDLHPRWSRDGQRICIDSMHTGVRQIYVIELQEGIIERLSET